MKKLILLSILFIVGCSSIGEYMEFWENSFRQTDLSHVAKVRKGMTPDDVIEIMGNPVLSELYKNVEEWHYCDTGTSEDTYVALFFVDDYLTIKYFYKNSSSDGSGGFGSCDKFVKKGNYKIPSEIQAILDKNTPDPPK